MLAHREGFLFELFRDTGLYSLPLKSDLDGYVYINEDDYDSNQEEKEQDQENEEEDDTCELDSNKIEINTSELAIDQVAKMNEKSKIKINYMNHYQASNQSNLFQVSNLNLSSNLTSRYLNSEYSTSLISVDKDSYCQKYLSNFIPSETKTDSNQNNTSISKKVTTSTSSTLNSPSSSPSRTTSHSSSISQKNQPHSQKFTPPGEVLATINKWLQKSKQVIEIRNKIILRKNNLNFI